MIIKNTKYISVSIVLSLILLMGSGEIIARVFGATIVYEYNQKLGWAPKKNFVKNMPVVDQSREKYFVDYSTNEYGFREFGDLKSNKKRILFVGDSWTGDPYTSDDDAYFGIVKQELPVEVFAIGAGGYGTLQELMLIREYAPMIKPDILVLQFTDNDFTNNSYVLEGPSIIRAQKNLRPYWRDNRIEYRLPPDSLYLFFYKHSRLFRSLDGIISNIQFLLYKSYYPPSHREYDWYLPNRSPELGSEFAEEKEKVIAVTRFLMLEMKRALSPDTRLVTFSASSDYQEDLDTWITLASATGFTAYPEVSMAVEKAEKNGEVVRMQDGAHWNRLGNKIAGEELVKILRRDVL